MRVIDGMHRLRAAMVKGEDSIEVEFFDGTEEEAFARAVELNIAHGLPLSLADRKAAAARILANGSQLSDRAVASITGLANKTVAAVRARLTEEDTHSNGRIGADGRRRPLDGGEGRRRAARLLGDDPGLPLRDVAAAAGISVGTAHDVRRRLQAGQDPVPAGQRALRRPPAVPPPREPATPLAATPLRGGRQPEGTAKTGAESSILQYLRKDPAVRLNEQGRRLLVWLHRHAIDRGDWTSLVSAIPPHTAPVIARLAHQYAEEWRALADHLDPRPRR